MRPLILLLSGALEDAWISWSRGGWRTLFGTLVLALAIVPLGALRVVDQNLRVRLKRVEAEVNLTVYAPYGIDPQAAAALRDQLRAQRGVAGVAMIDPGTALARLKSAAPDLYDLAAEMQSNPLPWSFELELKPEARDPAGLQKTRAALAALPGVGAVDADLEWARDLEGFSKAVTSIGYAYALLLALGAVFTVGAVLKMTYLLKRDQVEIMKLVGATRLAIALPFFLEGTLIGLGGGAAALGALKLLHLGIHHARAPQLAAAAAQLPLFLPPGGALAVVLAGAALGAAGGVMTLGRELQR